MENATYVALTRQSGLMAEMRAVANNISNANTTGYRAEGVVFSEYIRDLGTEEPSLAMAAARVRDTSQTQGALSQTGGSFDLAIQGEGFFLVQAPQGERLTRAGTFTPDENGDLVTVEGYPVLDAGGAPVFIPQGVGEVRIAPDGTISAAGTPVGQVGLFVPTDPSSMTREDGVRFAPGPGYVPAQGGKILQGYLEESNVNPIVEISRMIEVQRAYELGQGLLEREDERIRSVMQMMNR